MPRSNEDRANHIRSLLKIPWPLPAVEQRFSTPDVEKPHEISWVFQSEGWAEHLGVPDFPTIVPVLDFEEKNDLGDASRIVTAMLSTWREPNKYFSDLSLEELDQMRISVIEGMGRESGYQEPGSFIQSCINSARPFVGSKRCYTAFLHAWENFNYILNLHSMLGDGWLFVEGTNSIDPRPILANIVLSGHQILEIPYSELGSYLTDGDMLTRKEWNHAQSQSEYRYMASLILLGLIPDAAEELENGLFVENQSNEYFEKIMDALELGNADFGTVFEALRVVYSR
jgi:hypothetical protein